MDETPTPPDPGEMLDEFAERHWTLAARHAWQMYQERGRGAVVWRVKREEQGRKLPLNYLTFRGSKEDVMGTELEIVRHLIDSYDPEKQAVLAINFEDGTTVIDVYEKEPSPPDCADQNGHADDGHDEQDAADSPATGMTGASPLGGSPAGEDDAEPGTSGADLVSDDDLIDVPAEIDTPDAQRGDGANEPPDFDDGTDDPGGNDDTPPDLPDFLGDDPDGGALA